jgi:outer membrane protein assembly factor BamB
MKCHDVRHTGRSPYSTADNPYIEKWRFKCDWIEDSAVIGADGTLYFGDEDWYFYAVYPDGMEKWNYKTGGDITSAPAINEDGLIYVGSWDAKLYAFYQNGTLRWRVSAGGTISSSPAIGKDGTIYVGTMRGFDKGDVIAFYPNGTKKWVYETGYHITSDPAIGDDGTIYIGSLDTYFYAIYPDGTLRWRFKTGDIVKGSPSIADDGTIYFGSFDDYLYALYPNGTMKWKIKIGTGAESNPSIDNNGIIYIGGQKLYAVYPNGTMKWSFNLGSNRHILRSCPTISIDGTIYIGVKVGEGGGGEILAVHSNGTEKWRKKIATFRVESSPCIGEDGTVYIGSSGGAVGGGGYLHAFGKVDSNAPPDPPDISGPISGKKGDKLKYYFPSVDPDNNPVSYYVDWGDGTTPEWSKEYASGEQIWWKHTFNEKGSFTIKAKVRDSLGEESDWEIYNVEITGKGKPKNLLNNLLSRFPLLEKIFLWKNEFFPLLD